MSKGYLNEISFRKAEHVVSEINNKTVTSKQKENNDLFERLLLEYAKSRDLSVESQNDSFNNDKGIYRYETIN